MDSTEAQGSHMLNELVDELVHVITCNYMLLRAITCYYMLLHVITPNTSYSTVSNEFSTL